MFSVTRSWVGWWTVILLLSAAKGWGSQQVRSRSSKPNQTMADSGAGWWKGGVSFLSSDVFPPKGRTNLQSPPASRQSPIFVKSPYIYSERKHSELGQPPIFGETARESAVFGAEQFVLGSWQKFTRTFGKVLSERGVFWHFCSEDVLSTKPASTEWGEWIGGDWNDHFPESEKYFSEAEIFRKIPGIPQKERFSPNFRLRNLKIQSLRKRNSLPPAIPYPH